METVNIKDAIIEYIGDGSMSAAARRMGITPSYLSRVVNGIKPPSEKVLASLGLEVCYCRIHGPRKVNWLTDRERRLAQQEAERNAAEPVPAPAVTADPKLCACGRPLDSFRANCFECSKF